MLKSDSLNSFLSFDILEKIGEGGMGEVYKARDRTLKRIVALKFIHPMYARQPELRKRFEREARLAASLIHPNITVIHDFCEEDGTPCIVMEYVEGRTLKDIILENGPLPETQALGIIEQIAAGLFAAHKRGIVHRDIKSENIIITPDGQAKIMDFGLAKLYESAQVTKSGVHLGTVAYMSPEQVRGERIDYRTDIWSLGIVFYEMLTGMLPFVGDSDVSTMYAILKQSPNRHDTKKFHPKVEYLIANLLEKDRTLRYQSVGAFRKALKEHQKHVQTKLFIKKIRKNYKQILLVSIVVLLLIYNDSLGASLIATVAPDRRIHSVSYRVDIYPRGEITWTSDGSAIFYLDQGGGIKPNMYCLANVRTGQIEPVKMEHKTLFLLPGPISPRGDEIILYSRVEETDLWALGFLEGWE